MKKTKAKRALAARADVAVLRRFARNCRTLAYECAEGTAPPLCADHFTEGRLHCAMGEALARSVDCHDPWAAYFAIERVTESGPVTSEHDYGDNNASRILIEANNDAAPENRHAAVVFPLLYFADRAEAALRKVEAPAAPLSRGREGKGR